MSVAVVMAVPPLAAADATLAVHPGSRLVAASSEMPSIMFCLSSAAASCASRTCWACLTFAIASPCRRASRSSRAPCTTLWMRSTSRGSSMTIVSPTSLKPAERRSCLPPRMLHNESRIFRFVVRTVLNFSFSGAETMLERSLMASSIAAVIGSVLLSSRRASATLRCFVGSNLSSTIAGSGSDFSLTCPPDAPNCHHCHRITVRVVVSTE
mmetsp:Transcript_690/g.1896  ORF Transcript_690/g.1896 Transcript_690/m.1896 type:complete len:211 (-) Transcript_690:43-675(-)